MANYNLNLEGAWLFHSGGFEYRAPMTGSEYHASAKSGGAVSHLKNFASPESWKSVTVPHDWLTDIPISENLDATPGCKARGVGWYKKSFTLQNEPIVSAELVFDGVLGKSEVFVNGTLAVRNFSGYNRFSVEISDYLLPGEENEIAVFVDATRHEGWWYEGAGIYRPVNILFRDECRLFPENCFIRTEKSSVIADISFLGPCDVRAALFDADGFQISELCESAPCHESASTQSTKSITLSVPAPIFWSPENPYLYTLRITLEDGERVLDTAEFSIGLRDIKWVPNEGMYLNGKPYLIKGICAHQDHAGLGAALTPEVEEYRIRRMKSLGANAYRTAHHAPSSTILDICDRLGMLVLVENRHFNLCPDTINQLEALVKLSRSHTSVFAYCLFNEEPWQSESRGKRIVEKLRSAVLAQDPTRPVTAAQNAGALMRHNASEALDVVGMNYNLDSYEELHGLCPEKIVLGTENSPTFATRAAYCTSKEKQVFADDSTEYPASFSQPLYETIATVKNHAFVAGSFVWCGLDHGGEPNPYEYPSVSSHWGFLDNCGFDKNIAYWLKSYYLETPYLKLAEFSDAPTVGTRRYTAFTNQKSVELFINGKSLGTKSAENNTVIFEADGDFETVTAISKGAELSDTLHRRGVPAALSVYDAANENSAQSKIKILNISITDENGNGILSENGVLSISGEILGAGNGDPNSHSDCKPKKINLFGGKAQIIAQVGQKITLSYGNLPEITV